MTEPTISELQAQVLELIKERDALAITVDSTRVELDKAKTDIIRLSHELVHERWLRDRAEDFSVAVQDQREQLRSEIEYLRSNHKFE